MSDFFEPKIFEVSRKDEGGFMESLEPNIRRLDLLGFMISELEKVRMTSGIDVVQYSWVIFPWLNLAIRMLSKDDFVELRTSRNRYKINQEEQEFLEKKTIGVVGLSVGKGIAKTLAQERICGSLRLADFDILETSNLNRIQASLKDVGIHKTVSCAREIKEFDPYFEIDCYNEGITSNNIEEFLEGESGIDLLIDECDSLEMKVKLRQHARKAGIPVLMDTSDRGMIDIERFDLEPDRKLFHGRLDDFDPPQTWQMSDQDRVRLFAQIIDIEKISERGKYSLGEIGKSITTWPQLASDVVAGAGICAKIARKILLGEEVGSGRYYFDVDETLKRAAHV